LTRPLGEREGLTRRRCVTPRTIHTTPDEVQAMTEHDVKGLDLEVVEVERGPKPGCSGSSSTNPHCTCPVISPDHE
jgi:hypothetical protein